MDSVGSVTGRQFEKVEEEYAEFDRRQFELATQIERKSTPIMEGKGSVSD